jgi:ubiquinone/menaquinone biosynthesis C-methylase UbiE
VSSDPHERQLDRVANRWDATAVDRTENPIQGWMDSPLVLETCILPKVGGGRAYHWLHAAVDRHAIPKGGRWLSVGCGSAGTEIAASRWGLFSSLRGLDVSAQSLDLARRAAAEQAVTNIEFESADFNRLRLRRCAYDVVLANMSLHHVRELHSLLSEICKSLRPEGWLIVNEFVGPRQFQFTDLQLGLVRQLLRLLPERYRKTWNGEIKTEYVRMPVEHWNAADPSEAIRSDRILPEIERRFRVVERADYGGTLLHLLLEHIVHNFDAADEQAVTILKLLGHIEDTLIRGRVIASDFVFLLARKGSGFLGLTHRW